MQINNKSFFFKNDNPINYRLAGNSVSAYEMCICLCHTNRFDINFFSEKERRRSLKFSMEEAGDRFQENVSKVNFGNTLRFDSEL